MLAQAEMLVVIVLSETIS